ncbi:hypothetical protein AB4581_09325 [Vibrio cyclitrophicus]|uniref:hypothetical protein n=1 Tax=Vibrio splendidus TaxID=29497 RepID=UPI000C85600F|nr:hypothetical protein [Vibrio splendidus]PMK36900.1 hypothetical protein BCU01_03715 [Vibrio splendidus]
MSNVDVLLKQAVDASLQQTAASKQLSDDVKGKIGQINATVAAKVKQLDAWKESATADKMKGVARYQHVIDLTDISTDYFFPVWWRMPSNEHGGCEINITRHYSRDSALKPFGAGIVHIAGLLLQLEGNDCGWGGDGKYLQIRRISQTYRETVRSVHHGMRCIARPITGAKPLYAGVESGDVVGCRTLSGCYLRGGLKYTVITNWDGDIHFSKESGETEIDRSSQSTFEIKWVAKAYALDDPFLGERYPEIKLAHQYTNKQLFEPKS